MIPQNQLSIADNILFGVRGSRKKRDGINHDWDSVADGSTSIVGLHDFWFGTTAKTQRMISIGSDRTVRSYNSGTATSLTDSGTAWSGTLDQASMVTYNNRCFMAVSGANNVMKMYPGSGTVTDVGFIITDISVASPTVVTATGHGLTTGNSVIITGSNSTPSINGTHTITVTSPDTFTIVVNVTVQGTRGTVTLADGVPPKASIMREHLGRLWTNDKSNVDRLHYCETSNHTQWQGQGDSGAIDIGVGDGDPEGITAIFPSFKGELFVAKRTKLYRISGYEPETFQVTLVSEGIGCVSHNSIAAVDQDDVLFVSERGVHSLSATDRFGDFEGAFASADIQGTFNDDLNRSRLRYSWGAYCSQINSVAFAFATIGNSTNDVVYLYNVPQKSWYRWPNLSCESLIVANDSDRKRFYLGTNTSRVSKTLNDTNYDVDSAGDNQAINPKVTTGIIYPTGSPYSQVALKQFILYYRPEGTHTLTATVRMDNLTLSTENILTFSNTTSGDLLGSTFILGTSLLGSTSVLISTARMIDGIGHGFKVEITQSGVDQALEIQGFAIEYEEAGTAGEAR